MQRTCVKYTAFSLFVQLLCCCFASLCFTISCKKNQTLSTSFKRPQSFLVQELSVVKFDQNSIDKYNEMFSSGRSFFDWLKSFRKSIDILVYFLCKFDEDSHSHRTGWQKWLVLVFLPSHLPFALYFLLADFKRIKPNEANVKRNLTND